MQEFSSFLQKISYQTRSHLFIVVVLVLSVVTTTLSVYNLSQVKSFRGFAAATNFTLGITAVGKSTDSGNGNSITCNKATATSTGVLSSMSVYVAAIDTTKKNYSLAIYADSNNNPTILLSSANGLLVANSWNTLSFSAPIAANSNYWLCYNTNTTKSASNNIKYSAGTAAAIYKNQTYGTWPATFGTVGARWADNYSIYATVAVADSGTPAPTAIPTLIPTSTLAPTNTSAPATATPTTGVTTIPSTVPSVTSTQLNGLLIGMGDSYTSAYGAPPYISPSEPCYHSQSTSYVQVAKAALGSGVTVKNIGCSGADTADVQKTYSGESAQTGRLAGAKWVAMTIGGNDYDFLGAVTQKTSGPSRVINNLANVKTNVKGVITKVKTNVPGVKVFIFGYPDILPTDASKLSQSTCFGSQASNVSLSAAHNMYVQLNNTIKQAAQETGAIYIDAPTAFVGHDMCQPTGTNWIARLNQDGDEHPNVDGHKAMGELLKQAIIANP
jgi:lysophospholipase L1-like esterase